MTLDLKLMQSQNDCMLSAFFFFVPPLYNVLGTERKEQRRLQSEYFFFNEMYFLLQIYKHEGCFVDVILWHLEQ